MPKSKSRGKPIVFISSTAEDLKEFRKRVGEAALALGLKLEQIRYQTSLAPSCFVQTDLTSVVKLPRYCKARR